MRGRNKNASPLVLPKRDSTDSIPQQLNCYEGESLVRLLKPIRREITQERVLDKALPDKVWLKQQFSIGINDVTRVLERMPPVHGCLSSPPPNATICTSNKKACPVQLQGFLLSQENEEMAILVASDCNPRWLTKHLPSLALSRDVPIIFVKDTRGGSLKLGELVNLKTALAVGVKARGNAINQLIDEILGGRCDQVNDDFVES